LGQDILSFGKEKTRKITAPRVWAL